jgi:hypothetical protein
MNKRYIKIGAITLVSLGAIYGGYKLFKYLTKPTEEGDLPVDIVDTSGEEVKTVSKPSFNADKVVSLGSKGGEVGAIQIALNNIIKDAKKGKSKDATKESRRKNVASLTLLKTDGVFGQKTMAVLVKIMGKTSASYNEVKTKRTQFAEAYGLSNPYA